MHALELVRSEVIALPGFLPLAEPDLVETRDPAGFHDDGINHRHELRQLDHHPLGLA